MTPWYNRPSPEKKMADELEAHLEVERAKRKFALSRLKEVIEDMPIDTVLAAIASDMAGEKK